MLKTAKERARAYMDEHRRYVAAMQALLDDLQDAQDSGDTEKEDFLCEVLAELRALHKDSSAYDA